MEHLPQSPGTYPELLDQIAETLETGRRKVWQAANSGQLSTYWSIGRTIFEYEQEGSDRATYGTKLLARLSKDLTLRMERALVEVM